MRRQIGGWLVVIGIAQAILTACGAVRVHAKVRAEVYGWYEQALAAGDAQQFGEFMGRLTSAMESQGMTSGHSAFLIQHPGNDMAVDYRVMKALTARAEEIAKYPVGSMDYAKSLEECREQLTAASFSPEMWWYVHKAPFLWWWAVLGTWVCLLVCIVACGVLLG